MRSRSSPAPTTTPCARDRSISAPAAALRSMSSCTFAARGARHDDAADDAGRRDHRHVGPHAVARALVDRHRPEIRAGAAGDDLGRRSSAAACCRRSSSSCCSAARPLRRARAPAAARPAAAASSRFSCSFSCADLLQGDVVRSTRRGRRRRRRRRRRAAPRRTRRRSPPRAPARRASSSTCAEIRMMCADDDGEEQVAGALADVEQGHDA